MRKLTPPAGILATALLTLSMQAGASDIEVGASPYITAELAKLEAVATENARNGAFPAVCLNSFRSHRAMQQELVSWAASLAKRDGSDIRKARDAINVNYYEELRHASMLFAGGATQVVASKNALVQRCQREMNVAVPALKDGVKDAARDFEPFRAGDITTDFATLYMKAYGITLDGLTSEKKDTEAKAKAAAPAAPTVTSMVKMAKFSFEPKAYKAPAVGLKKAKGALTAAEWAKSDMPAMCKSALKSFNDQALEVVDALADAGIGALKDTKAAKAYAADQVGNIVRTIGGHAHEYRSDKAMLGQITKECTALSKSLARSKSDALFRVKLEAGALESWLTSATLAAEPLGAKAVRIVREALPR